VRITSQLLALLYCLASAVYPLMLLHTCTRSLRPTHTASRARLQATATGTMMTSLREPPRTLHIRE
jgi:hypothetical protein